MDAIRIASFEVDHTTLLPGIYLSRTDDDIQTYDLRFCRPNQGSYLTSTVMHTIEHLFATYVRNSNLGEKVIYFGPMGCSTGFYLILRDVPQKQVLQLVMGTMEKIIAHTGRIFGATPVECGNYRDLELLPAQEICRIYYEMLKTRENTFEY